MSTPHDEFDDFDDDLRAAGPVESHRGAVVLVMGILALMFFCFIFGLIAVFMGRRDLDLMRRGLMDREGEALTKVGYILGIVGSILSLVVIALYVLLFGLVFAFR